MAMCSAVWPSNWPGASCTQRRDWYGVLTSVRPYSLIRYLTMAGVEGVLASRATCSTFSPPLPWVYTLHWLGNSRMIACGPRGAAVAFAACSSHWSSVLHTSNAMDNSWCVGLEQCCVAPDGHRQHALALAIARTSKFPYLAACHAVPAVSSGLPCVPGTCAMAVWSRGVWPSSSTPQTCQITAHAAQQ
jgi:hypothetical protein